MSGRVAAALLQALSLVLVARALPVAEFGYLTAFLGVVTLVQVLFDCGVGTFIARERASSPQSGGVSAALGFTTMSSGVMLLVVGVGLVVAALAVSSVYWYMLPLALWATAERNADVRVVVAFADGDVHVSILNLVLRRVATIVLFVAAIVVDVPALFAFAMASGLAAMGSATFANVYIRRRVTAPPSLTYAEILREARPFWVTSVATQARNLDAVLVATFAGPVQAGLYGSGSRLITPLQVLPSALAALLLPASARAQASRRALARLLKLTMLTVAALTVVYAGLFLAAPAIVDVALGERYEGTATVIRLILLGMPFSVATALFIAILQGRGLGRAVARAVSVNTACCLIGVCIAAPFAGAQGAAAVFALSSAVQTTFLARSVRSLWSQTTD